MRLLLVIAVIALFVDAFFYSGAYTQATFNQVRIAGQQLVESISDEVDDVSPESPSRP